MDRFKYRHVIILGLVIAFGVVLGAGVPWLFGGGGSPPEGSRLGQGIALAAPALQGDAFPSDEAGFSGYLDVGTLIDDTNDLETVASAVCTESPSVVFGENHMLCDIVWEFSLVTVHLYADVNGMVVAYFADGQTVSRAAIWSGDGDNPSFDGATAGLDEAIKQVVEAVGGDYPTLAPNTGYYHWGFTGTVQPELLTTMVKQTETNIGGVYTFAIPPCATLYEASITAFGVNNRFVMLDDVNRVRTISSYRGASRGDGSIDLRFGAVAPGVLHKVQNPLQVGHAFFLLTNQDNCP